MKPVFFIKIFLFFPFLLTALFLAAGITNYHTGKSRVLSHTETLKADPLTLKVAAIFETKCMDCHSTKGELPFYAKLPLVQSWISEHIEEGLEEFDLEKEFFESEPGNYSGRTLRHIREVIEDNSMPLVSYRVLHWGSNITPSERALILDWLQQQNPG